MKKILDLTGNPWALRGWHAWQWRLALSRETGHDLLPVAGPVPVRVPGSVQGALRDAGMIPDWNEGLNSLACEWIENRHWTFETRLPVKACRNPGRRILVCDGLDGTGLVRCGGSEVGHFGSAFTPHRFELGQAIDAFLAQKSNARTVPLEIVFTDQPRNLGQVNYTSRIREEKPRFNYGWDWMIRLVQIGIWDGVRLEISNGPVIENLRMFTEFDATEAMGRIRVFAKARAGKSCRWRATLKDGRKVVASAEAPASRGSIHLEAQPLKPWWPAGMGRQPLYQVCVELLDRAGRPLDEATREVGFRELCWSPCKGAPRDAEPWILNANGQALFLAGVNWTPLRPNFADAPESMVRDRLETYRNLGFNTIRVWGGAVPEKEFFYQECDRLGLLVWQDFPWSSSGIDNWTPEDPEDVARAGTIAESIIVRRQHHPSLMMWCGGNELQFGPGGSREGGGVPLGVDHPPLAALARTVRRLDPGRRFIPTSPCGPRFAVDLQDVGKGRHHCVHGPWDLPGTMDEWRSLWENSDAMFHSEAGVPGAASADTIRRACGNPCLPADESHPAWRHAAPWWLQWKSYLDEGGDSKSLAGYVRWSQRRQAEGLTIAMRACMRRFPRCGGFIVWMGHDAFPCPVNTSILDNQGRLKPAATALRKILSNRSHLPPIP
jgi:beta-mannosidase